MWDGIPQGSPSPSDPDFNPELFLTMHHQHATIAQLETGLANLRRAVSNRTEQMRQLVKEHLSQFLRCKETADEIHDKISAQVETKEALVPRLQAGLHDAQDRAEAAFRPLLERKREADRIRRALAALGKFQYVLALPGSLRRNIRAQLYDKVVRDYKKARSLVLLAGASANANAAAASAAPVPVGAAASAEGAGAESEAKEKHREAREGKESKQTEAGSGAAAGAGAGAGTAAKDEEKEREASAAGAYGAGAGGSGSEGDVLRRVVEEVECVVEELRRRLLEKLTNPKGFLEDQQRVIALLLELECKEDPAWFYLSHQGQWIGDALNRAHLDYTQAMDGLDSLRPQLANAARLTPLPRHSHPLLSAAGAAHPHSHSLRSRPHAVSEAPQTEALALSDAGDAEAEAEAEAGLSLRLTAGGVGWLAEGSPTASLSASPPAHDVLSLSLKSSSLRAAQPPPPNAHAHAHVSAHVSTHVSIHANASGVGSAAQEHAGNKLVATQCLVVLCCDCWGRCVCLCGRGAVMCVCFMLFVSYPGWDVPCGAYECQSQSMRAPVWCAVRCAACCAVLCCAFLRTCVVCCVVCCAVCCMLCCAVRFCLSLLCEAADAAW